ncbi:hypothetical protein L2E82_40265 [Cichorium intybus]|uniref:Uncharacterized protein n=1 Tax=Cichorium intybus TaxID=13427 RepID=A0ACB9AJV6_CICIN|nr:hypothetical protein L2E82_40265 [Cichorium intybus]
MDFSLVWTSFPWADDSSFKEAYLQAGFLLLGSLTVLPPPFLISQTVETQYLFEPKNIQKMEVLVMADECIDASTRRKVVPLLVVAGLEDVSFRLGTQEVADTLIYSIGYSLSPNFDLINTIIYSICYLLSPQFTPFPTLRSIVPHSQSTLHPISQQISVQASVGLSKQSVFQRFQIR